MTSTRKVVVNSVCACQTTYPVPRAGAGLSRTVFLRCRGYYPAAPAGDWRTRSGHARTPALRAGGGRAGTSSEVVLEPGNQ